MFSKLQYISQGNTSEAQLQNISEALVAGCKWIQLRFKNAAENEFIELAYEVKKRCMTNEATFIVNDHPNIAKEVLADGVHLGLNDMQVEEAKKILRNKIIGGTANTLQDVLKRVKEECSYVGLGPFRFTNTKEKLSPILGLQGYINIMNELNERNIHTPIYAIGGIQQDDISAIMQTGIYGIAMSGTITQHPDKKLLLTQLNALLI